MDCHVLRVRRRPDLHDARAEARDVGAAAVDPDLPRPQGRLPEADRQLARVRVGRTDVHEHLHRPLEGREPPADGRRRLHPPARPEEDRRQLRAALRLPRRLQPRERPVGVPQGEARTRPRQEVRRALRARRADLHGLVRDEEPARIEPLPSVRRHDAPAHRRVLLERRHRPRRDDRRRRGVVDSRSGSTRWVSRRGSTRRSTSSDRRRTMRATGRATA